MVEKIDNYEKSSDNEGIVEKLNTFLEEISEEVGESNSKEIANKVVSFLNGDVNKVAENFDVIVNKIDNQDFANELIKKCESANCLDIVANKIGDVNDANIMKNVINKLPNNSMEKVAENFPNVVNKLNVNNDEDKQFADELVKKCESANCLDIVANKIGDVNSKEIVGKIIEELTDEDLKKASPDDLVNSLKNLSKKESDENKELSFKFAEKLVNLEGGESVNICNKIERGLDDMMFTKEQQDEIRKMIEKIEDEKIQEIYTDRPIEGGKPFSTDDGEVNNPGPLVDDKGDSGMAI